MSADRPRKPSPRPTPRPAPRTTRSTARPTARGSVRAGASRSAPRGTSAATATAVATAPARAPRERREERPSLELVAAQRSRRRLRIAGITTFGLVFGSMLGLAVFHSVLVQGQLHVDQLDSQIRAEQERQSALRLQVAQLGAPQRIIVAAGEQGMVPPDDRKFLPAIIPGSAVPPPVTTKAPATTKSSSTTKPATATATTVAPATSGSGAR